MNRPGRYEREVIHQPSGIRLCWEYADSPDGPWHSPAFDDSPLYVQHAEQLPPRYYTTEEG